MKSLKLTWAGGEHYFLLNISHLRALQDICDAGPDEIASRLAQKKWRVDDVIATMRLGLEGGGLDKNKALKLVTQHVEDNLSSCVILALLIIQHAIYGDLEDTPSGEAEAEAVTETSDLREKMESGIFPTSTNGQE